MKAHPKIERGEARPSTALKRKRKREKTYEVWVRLGFGFATGSFIEDVTQYEPAPDRADRYHRATLRLDSSKRRKK
jgi:hypothetical protein